MRARRTWLFGLLPVQAVSAGATGVLTVLSVGMDRPTPHALGVQVLSSDDNDHDARIDVRHRAPCSSAWRSGPPLFPVRPETVVGPGTVLSLVKTAAARLRLDWSRQPAAASARVTAP